MSWYFIRFLSLSLLYAVVYCLTMNLDRSVFISKSHVRADEWCDKRVLNPLSPSSSSSAVSQEGKESQVVQNLQLLMLKMKSKYFMYTDSAGEEVDSDFRGQAVDYSAMAASEEMLHYESLLPQLHHIDLASLPTHTRKSLCLNLYNALTLHALCRAQEVVNAGNARDMSQRLLFYSSMSYIIGSAAYSLNDLEHGVLRCNQPSPVLNAQIPFSKEGDPRYASALTELDPRIHFAMNCGAKSCPPISVYHDDAEKLNRQLNMATSSYLNQHCRVLPEDKKVQISKLLLFYRNDFLQACPPSDRQDCESVKLLRWIQAHSSGKLCTDLSQLLEKNPDNEDIELLYEDYDWDLNGV